MPDDTGRDVAAREDSEIARRFAELRRFDDATAPSYAGIRRRRLPRRRALRPAAAASLLLLILLSVLVLVRPGGGRRHGRGETAGLQPDAPVEVAAGLAQWRSPTDFLLQTTGSELLSDLPVSPQPPPGWMTVPIQDPGPRTLRSPGARPHLTPAQKGATS